MGDWLYHVTQSMLICEYNPKTVQDILDLSHAKRLNLNPGFQRNSIWNSKDRATLIDSILKGFPLPSIFLYRRENDRGEPVYDVLDGKQRIESILMFMGKLRGRDFRFDFLPEGEKERTDWTRIKKRGDHGRLLSFRFQVAEVSGEWEEIVSLFVRINSTGKKLARAEITRADHLKSDLLKGASVLARRWSGYLIESGVLSSSEVDRYRHVELMCELIVSAHAAGVINKKDALEKALEGNTALKGRSLQAAIQSTSYALTRLRALLKNPRETRFHKISDFYSLVVVLQQLNREKLVFHSAVQNEQARQMLRALSTGVDKLNEMKRKLDFTPLQADQELFRSYLATVQEGTDALINRKPRHQILYKLLAPIFEKKDEDRLFNEEQRRILWNSAGVKHCPGCPPGSKLRWSDLAIDHIKPHALGGKTVLENAQICCRKHNSKWGKKDKKAA
jgi:hypothetical protein